MMMMLNNRTRKIARWIIGLLLVMITARLVIFGLAAAGLITWGGSSSFSWLWIMPVLMLLIMALMLFLGPRGMHGTQEPGAEESPSEILARRFARGEITKEQYEEMEQTLREHLAASSAPGSKPRDATQPTSVGR
jgi:putative membrane protein